MIIILATSLQRNGLKIVLWIASVTHFILISERVSVAIYRLGPRAKEITLLNVSHHVRAVVWSSFKPQMFEPDDATFASGRGALKNQCGQRTGRQLIQESCNVSCLTNAM
jgi:hypothetical protein